MTAAPMRTMTASIRRAVTGIFIAIGIIIQATSSVAQYSSYAVSRDAVYYTVRADNSTYFARRGRNQDTKPTRMAGTNYDATKDRNMQCITPPFPARLIAAGDTFLYVLSATGALMAAKKPLTKDTVFYDTGFSAPGATLLSMPIDYDSVYILDANGAPNESICSTPNVNCSPDGPTPKPKPENPSTQTADATPTSSITSGTTSASATESSSQTAESTQSLTALTNPPPGSKKPAGTTPTAALPSSTEGGTIKTASSQESSNPQGLSTGILAGIIVAVIIIVILIGIVIYLLRKRQTDALGKQLSSISSAGSGEPQGLGVKLNGGSGDEYQLASVSSYGATNLQSEDAEQSQQVAYENGITLKATEKGMFATPNLRMASPKSAHPRDQPVQVTMMEKESYVSSSRSGAVSNHMEEAPPMYEGSTGNKGSFDTPSWDQKH
ncbi:hypothetical protein HDU97_004503 [Phlyctochytrium planicorne]|nr:hypothetical protein HDU97_004503 [Phlyctochytrium planicorne]